MYPNQPLDLIMFDYLAANMFKVNFENVLLITNHFTKCAQAYVNRNQTSATTVLLLWKNFILHDGFLEKIISGQGRNFESSVIKDICRITGVQKVRTTLNGPHFWMCWGYWNQKRGKTRMLMFPPWYMPTIAPETTATGFCPFYLMYGRRSRSSIDKDFDLGRSEKQLPPNQSIYVKRLRERLKYAHKKAKDYSEKQKSKHKFLYASRCKCNGRWLRHG